MSPLLCKYAARPVTVNGFYLSIPTTSDSETVCACSHSKYIEHKTTCALVSSASIVLPWVARSIHGCWLHGVCLENHNPSFSGNAGIYGGNERQLPDCLANEIICQVLNTAQMVR
jgi:hypothetical protein